MAERLVNSVESWSSGAFNSGRIVENPLDYGWGIYNPQVNQVIGNKVFVLKMRNGSYKKMMIDSLVIGTYYFRHAELDGSNEQSARVNTADFVDAGFAFFSFSSNATIQTLMMRVIQWFDRENSKVSGCWMGRFSYQSYGKNESNLRLEQGISLMCKLFDKVVRAAGHTVAGMGVRPSALVAVFLYDCNLTFFTDSTQ